MLQHLAPKDFEPETITLDGRTLRYRSCRGVPYCERPQDPIQVLNIFVPEAYFEGGSISGYTAETAPVFCPSTVGGYMPGPAAEPGPDHFFPTNAVFEALAHGYVIAGIGVRGRTTGSTSTEFFMGGSVEAREAAATGRLCGRAPAFIVDLKAGIRYLRTYAQDVPGDLGRIVTNGTSAGGAHSALAGTSGDSSDYTDELERIGAVMDASDAIFAASCYCPIHNLDHADMAYEWQFKGIADCHYTHFRKRDGKIVKISEDSVLTAEQQELSEELACAFPAYVRSLGLTDKDGTSLTLAEDGTGSFLDWIERQLIASAQRELETGANTQNLPQLMTEGSAPEALSCLSIEDGTVKGIDLSNGMLEVARKKVADKGLQEQITFEQGDCLRMRFSSESFDAVTVAFGVRNFEHIDRGYEEMYRVIKPGGMLCVLELSTPQNRFIRFFYDLYAMHIIPFVGSLKSGDKSAYRYLPESIAAVPQGEQMLEIMRSAGFKHCKVHRLTLGVCSIYTGIKL